MRDAADLRAELAALAAVLDLTALEVVVRVARAKFAAVRRRTPAEGVAVAEVVDGAFGDGGVA